MKGRGYIEKTQGEYVNALAPEFDSIYGSDIREHEKELFEKYLPKPPARIVDVGCGTGRLLPWLTRRGYKVLGLEPSKEMYRLCIKKIHEQNIENVSTENTGLLELYLESESFNAVLVLGNVLGGIPSHRLRQKFLHEAKRILVSGGLLFVDASNRFYSKRLLKWACRCVKHKLIKSKVELEFGDTLEQKFINNKEYMLYNHLFSVWELEDQLIASGFSILGIHGIKSVYGNSSIVSGFMKHFSDPLLIVCENTETQQK